MRITNLSLVQSALGDTEGQLEFFENAYSHASSALPIAKGQVTALPVTDKIEKILVPVITLDAYTSGQTWPKPVLVKLDVQGFERKVLEGARSFLSTVDFLLYECSYRAMYDGEPLFAEMYEFVASLGFELVAPVGFLEDDDNVMIQTDLLWRRR